MRLLKTMLCLLTGVSADGIINAGLRFPREQHLKVDDWPEFSHLSPKLRRWEKENNTVEHDPVNMEEKSVVVAEASSDFTNGISAAFSMLYVDTKSCLVDNAGFELVDLHPRILPFLRRVKKQGLVGARVGPTAAGGWLPFFGGGTDDTLEDLLARQLQGSDSFSLGHADTFHYAFRCAGFVIRKGGPEGSRLNGTGFDMVAQRVHIDQDLDGEPLLSMGLSWVFRLPYMRLLNIWSPLHDVRLRPMAFADRRTIHVAEDIVRYRTNSTPNAGGRFGSFRSDRLMSMYSSKHRWYWHPSMKFGQAIAFDTSNVPHSSFTLPGEHVLSSIRNDLVALRDTPERRSEICATTFSSQQLSPLDERFSLDMEAFIGSAVAFKKRACRQEEVELDEMLEYLTRASLEIRCVTLVAPRSVLWNATVALLASLLLSLFGCVARRQARTAKR